MALHFRRPICITTLTLPDSLLHQILLLVALLAVCQATTASESSRQSGAPNIVFVLVDDLGWGDLGCYGQTKIRTPQLDRMAAEGMRFTSAYCGTSVCAPSRCALMTGLDMGHAPIRANREIKPEGQMPLPPETATVGQLLQSAGYRTGLFGKWGLGYPGSGSEPTKKGFDDFFGYNCQRHAHGYYPEYLWRNDRREPIAANAAGRRGQYSHDLIMEEALAWVRQHHDRPMFLYLALTIPHGRWEVPDQGPYAGEPWPEVERNFAAMITRMDDSVGRLLALLEELKIDENTLVIFASDNGACEDSSGHKTEFFDSNGPLRGTKRGMYEGSLRVPAIARWPGRTPPGTVRDTPWAFWDFLPTAAELAGLTLPAEVKTNGRSIVPLLTGGVLPERECFYWELHEGPMKQAVRFGDWKAVRNTVGGPVELYDLAADPAEQHDVAATRPEVLTQAEALLRSARVDSPEFPAQPPRRKPRLRQ